MASKPPQNHSKPTSANPWDIPPPEPIGSPTAGDIYHSVGAALSAWEGLEEYLSELFCKFTRSGAFTARAAYGAVVAHGTRQDMLAAAASYHLLDRNGDPDTVKRILSEVSRLSRRRNDIAHGICGYKNWHDQEGYYLSPPIYAMNKYPDFGRKMKYAYNHAQIDAFAASFRSYGKTVRGLYDEIED